MIMAIRFIEVQKMRNVCGKKGVKSLAGMMEKEQKNIQ